MITARNYAAQAERGLLEFSKNSGYRKWDRDFVALIASGLKDAVHFVLPDDGFIARGNNDLLDGINIRLPFESMTIEWWRSRGERCLYLVEENDEGQITVIDIINFRNTDEWYPGIYIAVLPATPYSHDDQIMLEPIPTEYYEQIIQNKLQHENSVGRAKYGIYCLVELLEMLSCTNVEIVTHQDASSVNAKRAKKGKLPIYETKTLIIGSYNQRTGESLSGSHASPRQHLRRGHVRRLPKGNVWVNSCVVGDPAKGVISKDYRVR